MEVDPSDRRYLSEINVVPLVDVVLVLLVVFMITAPLLYRGLDITLPTSESNSIQATERLVVTVDRDGSIYMDKRRVQADNLFAAFRAAAERDPSLSVYLRADEAVAYGTVVQVMDAARKAGISQLGMVTENLPLRP